jgi:hypothetical protein
MADPREWWDSGNKWIDNALSNLLPDVVEKPLVAVQEYAIKPVVRSALAASYDASTLLTWAGSEIWKNPLGRSTGADAELSRGERFDKFRKQFIYGSGTSDMGTGFLPGGAAMESALQGIQDERARVGSHAFTYGRALAYPLVKISVINEDDFTHKLISGTIDFGVALKNPLDPFNRVPGFKPGTTARTSRVGVGGFRVSTPEDFGRVFDSLEESSVVARQPGVKPTASQLEDIKQYDALTANLTPTVPKEIVLPNGQKSFYTGFDSKQIYDEWKPKIDEALGDAFNQIGLVQDVLPTFIKDNFDRWKNSAAGAQWANDLMDGVRSGDLDAGELWRTVLKREGVLAAKTLVDEIKNNPNATPDDLWSIIEKARGNFNSGYNIRNLGRSALDTLRMGQSGTIKVATQKRGSQALEMLPESTRIGFTDIEQSARNIDDLLGSFGFEYKARNQWLDKFAAVMLKGTKDDFFTFMRDFESNAIRTRLQQITKVGTQDTLLTEAQIDALTSWSQKLRDEVMGYNYNDLSTNVPLPYIENGYQGVLRSSQLMADDYYVIPVNVIDQVLRLQTKMGRFIATEIAEGGVTGAAAKGYEQMRLFTLGYMTNYWKPAAVIKLGHTLRVGAEEAFRVNLSGILEHPMEWVLTMFGRQLSVDATGAVIPRKIENLKKFWVKLEQAQLDLQEGLSLQAQKTNGATLTPAEEFIVNNLNKLRTTVDDLEARIPNESYEIYNSLIGPRSRGGWLASTNEYAPQMMNMRQTGAVQFPERVDLNGNPTTAGTREAWSNGLAHELADMNSMPDYRRIAQQSLNPTDKLTINGKTRSLTEHINNGEIHPFTGQPLANDLDAVKLWLFAGEGRPLFEGYFNNTANLKPQYRNGGYDNYAVASDRVELIFNTDILHHTAGNPQLLELIATGKFAGEKAIFKEASGRGAASDLLKEYISNVFINETYAPIRVRSFPKFELSELTANLGQKRPLGLNNLLNKLHSAYFEGVYGRTSDFVARGPAWKANYWSRMEELVRFMSPEEANKVFDVAKGQLTRSRLDRLRTQVALANGTETVEAADQLASTFATKTTNDLLYKGNRSSLAQQHKVLVPFLSSYVEVFSTWAKLASQSPRIIRNTARFLDSAEEEGYIYRNQYGDKVFELPMTGRLAQIFTGSGDEPIGNFTINIRGLNIIGQVRPGVGPVVQYFIDKMLPKTEKFDWVREFIAPYGTPKIEEGGVFSWALPGSVNDFLATFGTDEAKFGDAFRLFFGDPKEKDYFQRGVIRMHQHLVNNYGEKYIGQKGLEQSYIDAEEAMNVLQRLRAASAALGPGAPMTSWIAKTQYGNIDLAVLLSDLTNKEQEAIKAGQPTYKAFGQWLDQWGELVWVYSGRITKGTVGGVQATREWQKWAGDNRDLIDKYKSVAGYFGPQTGEFDIDVWRQQYETDNRLVQNLEDATKQSHQRMGDHVYYRFLESVPLDVRKSPVFRAQRDDLINTLVKDLPLWQKPLERVVTKNQQTREQISQLRSLTEDKKYAGNPLVMVVKEYFDLRDQSLKNFIEKYPKVTVESWVNDNKSSYELRRYLAEDLAPSLIAKNPEFLQIWDRVLSNEFVPISD